MTGRSTRNSSTSHSVRAWSRVLLLALAMALTACTTQPAATDEVVADSAAAPADDTGTDDAGTDDAGTSDDDEGNQEPEDTTDEPPPEEEQPAASSDGALTPISDGTATATIGAEEYEFRVVTCLQDIVTPLGDDIALTVAGVPPDTPDELVDPIRDPFTAEEYEELGVEGMQKLIAPVLAYGPVLSMVRSQDDGESDGMGLQFEGGTAYLSELGGFIEVSGSGSDLTITGSATVSEFNINEPGTGTPDIGELNVQVSC